MSSLIDVARRAGVAVSTASLALNNKSRVSPATRERVQRAARELAYFPHSLARGLKTHKTETVGLFMKDFGGPVYNELVQAVQQTLAAGGYDMIVCFSHSSNRVLRGQQIDGAIVIDPLIADETIRSIASRGLPVVTLDRELRSKGVHAVLLDNRAGAAAVAAHLKERGYRDIVFVGGPEASYDGKRRREGFLGALCERGGKGRCLALTSDFTQGGGAETVRRFLEEADPPEVFACANDETAIGALEALRERGLRVPERVTVTGFDDITLSRYVRPALTTVRVPRSRWGELAAETLLDALAGRPARRLATVEVELVVRESTSARPPARSSRRRA